MCRGSCIALAIVILMVLIALISCNVISINEPFSERRRAEAEKLARTKPLFDNGDTNFTKLKRVHRDLDVDEYFTVRQIMKDCGDNCADMIYDALD